ncbi:hypothetical protein GJ496_006793 [Pomphorhynchus laevis]|nr:hypothetical protein GJ496_006793 [Pomphorhynchus laevis]
MSNEHTTLSYSAAEQKSKRDSFVSGRSASLDYATNIISNLNPFQKKSKNIQEIRYEISHCSFKSHQCFLCEKHVAYDLLRCCRSPICIECIENLNNLIKLVNGVEGGSFSCPAVKCSEKFIQQFVPIVARLSDPS